MLISFYRDLPPSWRCKCAVNLGGAEVPWCIALSRAPNSTHFKHTKLIATVKVSPSNHLYQLVFWKELVKTQLGPEHNVRFNEVLQEKTVSLTFYEVPVLFLSSSHLPKLLTTCRRSSKCWCRLPPGLPSKTGPWRQSQLGHWPQRKQERL